MSKKSKPEQALQTVQDVVTPELIETLKQTKAKGATDSELKLFIMQCNRTKLDPFSNQIHFIKRGNQATFQTAIDGFRVVAERSGQYQGQTEVEYGPLVKRTLHFRTYDNGQETKKTVEKEVPEYAKIGVYKSNFKAPLYVTAYWDEYCPSYPNQMMWIKMPRLMLSKVAEALALRKAFPNDLSGLYTNDEMQQADNSEINLNEVRPAEKTQEAPQVEDTKKEEQAEDQKNVEQINEDERKQVLVEEIQGIFDQLNAGRKITFKVWFKKQLDNGKTYDQLGELKEEELNKVLEAYHNLANQSKKE